MKFKKLLLGLLMLVLAITAILFEPISNVYAAETPLVTIYDTTNDIEYSYTTQGTYEFATTTNGVNFRDESGMTAISVGDDINLLIIEDSSIIVTIIDPANEIQYSYTSQGSYEFVVTTNGVNFRDKSGMTAISVGDDVNYLIIEYLIDNKVPVISGQTTFVANVDEEKPLSYFMSFLSAYDETDGDVTDSLTVITDNYTPNIRVLGNHTFTVEASDNSGNTATATINIRVVDIVAPIISGNTSTADIGYAETWNIESFRKTLSVTDNYQTMTNADIVIDTDGYTSNKTKLGTYTITFKATDESGNTGRFSKNVRVIDNVAPTFSGPSTIATSNFTILTESEVRAQLTAHDFIDGNITNRIELVEDNFTGKGNKVGSYTLVYSVTDNAGNTATHTVTVQRTDKIPPTIWVEDGASIRTTPDTPISRDIIIDILEATGQIQINATTTFSFPLDEYSGNEETPGVYAMTLMARSTTGNESVHSFAIEVLDVGNNEDPITREPSEWIQDNIVWLIVGGVALIGGAYFITKRK